MIKAVPNFGDFLQFLRNSPKSCGSTTNSIYHQKFLLFLVLRLLKARFHGNATKIEKMTLTQQLLMLDATFFFLNMQNTQVPICSQYII